MNCHSQSRGKAPAFRFVLPDCHNRSTPSLKQDGLEATQPRPKLSRVSGVLIARATHASHYRAHRNGIAVCIACDGLRHPTIHSIADLADGVHVACGCLGQPCPSYLTQSLMMIPLQPQSPSAAHHGMACLFAVLWD